MYRSRPEQASFSSTKRSAGVHTSTNAGYEQLAKCLLEVPLERSFSADATLVRSPASIVSLDYCTFETGAAELASRGAAFVSALGAFLARDSGTHNAPSHNLVTAFKVFRKSNPDNSIASIKVLGGSDSEKEVRKVGESGGDEHLAAKVVLVTTTEKVTKQFDAFLAQLSHFDGAVKTIVVGPGKVCINLRNRARVFCLPPGDLLRDNVSPPEAIRMLQVGVDNAFPNVTKFVGFVKFDNTVDHVPSLLSSLSAALPSRFPRCSTYIGGAYASGVGGPYQICEA